MGKALTWFWVLVAFSVLLWISLTSPELYDCLSNQTKNQTGNIVQEYITTFYVLLLGSRACFGAFIHSNGEAVIALFTVILTVATILLWIATQNLLREAGDTSRKQLRAYVSLTQTTTVDSSDNRFIEVSVQATNAGQTPAHDVDQWIDIGIWPLPLQKRWTHGTVMQTNSRLSLGPGGVTRLGPVRVDIQDSKILDDLKNGVLVAWGEIIYKDIFDDRHFSRFKMRIVRGKDNLWRNEYTRDNNFSD